MYKTHDVVELLKFRDVRDYVFEDNCIVIDDFYENIEDIHDYLTSRNSYPLWKYDAESDTRNSIDYNDCRVIDKIAFPNRVITSRYENLLNVCRKFYHRGEYHFDWVFEVNCFQTKTVFDSNLQHYPHIDSDFGAPDDFCTLNMIVYLDKQEDGGTAVYDGAWIRNNESINLLYPVEEEFELNKVIEHKYNRCVIFPGNRLHGAYINNYESYSGDKWRYAQVNFFVPR